MRGENLISTNWPNAEPIKLERLTHLQVLVYGSIMFPLAMGFSILIMIIPTYYGVNLGLGLGVVGIAIAVGRVFDFITDPIIGSLSDRTRGPLGARKPWIICGLVLFIFATYCLFVPQTAPSGVYCLIAACIYFLAFTITDIPLSAMGLEISKNTHERTRLAGSKLVFFIIGGIVGALIPTIWSNDLHQALIYVVAGITMAVLVVIPVFLIVMPTSVPSKHRPKPRSLSTIFEPYNLFIHNQNTRRIIGVFFLIMLSRSLSGSLALLYLTYILLAPDLIGPVWILSGLGLLCGVPVWYYFSKKFGKVRIWRWGILGSICLGLPLLTLGEGDATIMMVLAFGFGITGASETMMPISLLADHIADEKTNDKTVHPGALAALKNATSKLSIIAPMAIAFPILGAIGLSRDTVQIESLSNALTPFQSAILIAFYVGGPLFFRSVAFIIMPRLWPELKDASTREAHQA